MVVVNEDSVAVMAEFCLPFLLFSISFCRAFPNLVVTVVTSKLGSVLVLPMNSRISDLVGEGVDVKIEGLSVVAVNGPPKDNGSSVIEGLRLLGISGLGLNEGIVGGIVVSA